MPVPFERGSDMDFAVIRTRPAELEWDRVNNVPASCTLLGRDCVAVTVDRGSKDAFFIGTYEGKFAGANLRLLELLGYEVEDLIDRDIESICINPPEWDGLLEAVEKKGYAIDHKMKLLRSDGVELSCCITAAIRRRSGNSVPGTEPLFKSWVRADGGR